MRPTKKPANPFFPLIAGLAALVYGIAGIFQTMEEQNTDFSPDLLISTDLIYILIGIAFLVAALLAKKSARKIEKARKEWLAKKEKRDNRK